MDQSSDIQRLKAHLDSVPPGNLSGEDGSDAESHLIRCWDALKGSSEGGMAAFKLSGRTEGMKWAPPVLEFEIERHGGTVLGSTRAELQIWQVDLEQGTAEIVHRCRRQLRPMARRLDVKSLAGEIAENIRQGRKDHPSLKWMTPTRVRILIGAIIPATNNQTTTDRRRRFMAALEQVLVMEGWRRVKVGQHVFEKTSGTV